jgi:hypothetical protein
LCRIHGSFEGLPAAPAALDGFFIRIRSPEKIQTPCTIMRMKLQKTADSIPLFSSLRPQIQVPPSGHSTSGNRPRKHLHE